MAVFKCKMCGGTINFEEGASVGVCDSCGTKQTLPRLNDDRVRRLHDRANHFRRNKDFDKAAAIYEEILNEDNTDAEVYWSLVLCKYGIDYVESPDTHKQVPTVNRAQFTSIFDDANYKSALEHADSAQREIYEKEAEAINNIQKGILAISQKEEPFDIFICYKETDENGNRTPDSVLAYDLYHLLSKEGLKVFFSRVTLEDKLGTAYEPYIFAALSTAKVMVVMGTKPEYFNAVWVKNEWSRYLKLVEQSKGQKVIIPAYRDMDPYDLPDELSHLQALDMGKLGFMQDLTRGIKKIVRDGEEKPTTVISRGGSANTDALLKRAFMFLEEGNWADANAYCERVLDEDPENANAYLGKLMADLRVNYQDDLGKYKDDFSDNSYYEKAIRFGDHSLKAQLNEYIKTIKIRKEEEEIEKTYQKALIIMNSAYKKNEFLNAVDIFKSLGDYKDSQDRINTCLARVESIKAREEEELKERRIIEEKERLERERKEEARRIAVEKTKNKLKRNMKYILAVSFSVIFALLLFKVIIPNAKYKKALSAIDSNDYIKAHNLLIDLDGYKDSDRVLESIKDDFINQEKEERDKTRRYEQALSWIKEENYSEAYAELSSLGDFKDSKKLAEKIYEKSQLDTKYKDAISLEKDGKYMEALKTFKSLKNFKDSKERVSQVEEELERVYSAALAQIKEEKYIEAYTSLEGLGDYKDSLEKKAEISKDYEKDKKYEEIKTLISDRDYLEALNRLKDLKGFKDADKKIEEVEKTLDEKYKEALDLVEKEEYIKATESLDKLKGYKDVEEKIKSLADKCAIEEKYLEAKNRMNQSEYIKAYELLEEIKAFRDSASLAEEIYPKYIKQKRLEELGNKSEGEYITFGSYEQDGNIENGKEPIEWIVIKDAYGTGLYLVSRYVLDYKQLSSSEISNWRDSDLRKWLNNSFYSTAFTPIEQEMIEESVAAGAESKVSLLSADKHRIFLSDKTQKIGIPTPYAISNGIYVYTNLVDGVDTCDYWLVDRGKGGSDQVQVGRADGLINVMGTHVMNFNGVRPVIYIKLK